VVDDGSLDVTHACNFIREGKGAIAAELSLLKQVLVVVSAFMYAMPIC
jgi:hypothetical protein